MYLLDNIQIQLGLEYLSDLRFCNHKKIKALIQDFSEDDYPLSEWNDAAEYLTGKPAQFVSACEARQFLLNYK